MEEAVRRLLAVYCHTVDDGRFDEFAGLWAADAVVTVRGQEVRGQAAIRAWIEDAQPPEHRGRHAVLNTAVTVEADDRATAVSHFIFLARGEDRLWHVSATGRYRDVLVLEGGRWVFAAREIDLL